MLGFTTLFQLCFGLLEAFLKSLVLRKASREPNGLLEAFLWTMVLRKASRWTKRQRKSVLMPNIVQKIPPKQSGNIGHWGTSHRHWSYPVLKRLPFYQCTLYWCWIWLQICVWHFSLWQWKGSVTIIISTTLLSFLTEVSRNRCRHTVRHNSPTCFEEPAVPTQDVRSNLFLQMSNWQRRVAQCSTLHLLWQPYCSTCLWQCTSKDQRYYLTSLGCYQK